MKANELRIGNLVSFKGLWTGEVSRISESGTIEIKGNKGIFDIEDFRPVQIFRDILLKIGAEDFPDGESLSIKNRLIGYAECRNEFYDKSTSVALKYLHQLQNLYFAITGEELKVKL